MQHPEYSTIEGEWGGVLNIFFLLQRPTQADYILGSMFNYDKLVKHKLAWNMTDGAIILQLLVTQLDTGFSVLLRLDCDQLFDIAQFRG